MDILEKSISLNNLYDLYQNLLTDKQRTYFEQYYFDDYSITEISENMDVSRNAVHDLLKRTVQKLYDLEAKLGMQKQNIKREEIINKIKTQVSDEATLALLEELLKEE